MDIRDKVAELYPFPDGRDVSTTISLRSAFKAGAEWQQDQYTARPLEITDEQLNRLAQVLYSGINLTPDLRLVMDMTSKATLVRVLRQAMIESGILGDMNAWTVATLHQGCPKCEECVNLAVDSAKSTNSSGGSWQLPEPLPGSFHEIMHRAVVERKR